MESIKLKQIRNKLKKYEIIRKIYHFLQRVYEIVIIKAIKRKKIVHFLHIRKTGGTALKFALRNQKFTTKYYIKLHYHSFKLKDVPKGEKIFIFVRDPIQKFISGFCVRFREGKPTRYNPWSKDEKRAFQKFKTPNNLVESLSSTNRLLKNEAIRAMKTINHVKTSYWDWFHNVKYLMDRFADFLFVGQMGRFEKDFKKLKKILGLADSVGLPNKDDKRANTSPNFVDKHLTQLAKRNLKKWYSEDYEFLEILKGNELIS